MVLSMDQKKEIIKKYQLNWTIAKIATHMNVSQPAVHRVIKKHKLGLPLDRKPGSGIRIQDTNT